MHKRHHSKRMTGTPRDRTLRLRNAISDQTASAATERFVPQTQFGRRLWKIRAKIVASGQPLLEWEQIEQDLLERRGERAEEA